MPHSRLEDPSTELEVEQFLLVLAYPLQRVHCTESGDKGSSRQEFEQAQLVVLQGFLNPDDDLAHVAIDNVRIPSADFQQSDPVLKLNVLGLADSPEQLRGAVAELLVDLQALQHSRVHLKQLGEAAPAQRIDSPLNLLLDAGAVDLLDVVNVLVIFHVVLTNVLVAQVHEEGLR